MMSSFSTFPLSPTFRAAPCPAAFTVPGVEPYLSVVTVLTPTAVLNKVFLIILTSVRVIFP